MKELQGGLGNVRGYSYSAVECGIRYDGRLDYGLLVADAPCSAAGVFTTNRIVAAPVKLCRARIGNNIRAIAVNATNANACTGDEGLRAAESITRDIAERIGAPEGAVLMASTGIIGRQLPAEKMIASHGALVSGLATGSGSDLARAIMTTDTRPKEIAVEFSTVNGGFRIAGIAKGSGMIAPGMATLLCFIVTDAPVDRTDLECILRESVSTTLNAIIIDNDMSTNDTVLILSPLSDKPLSGDDLVAFGNALLYLLSRIAEMLVSDGEGTTKIVRVNVINAASEDDAKKAARAVAKSMLVKTALFGNDPNWGRIAAAAGYSGADVSEERISISIGGISLLKNGTPDGFKTGRLVEVMKTGKFDILIDLGMGSSTASVLTTDLSIDYVKINAEYST